MNENVRHLKLSRCKELGHNCATRKAPIEDQSENHESLWARARMYFLSISMTKYFDVIMAFFSFSMLMTLC